MTTANTTTISITAAGLRLETSLSRVIASMFFISFLFFHTNSLFKIRMIVMMTNIYCFRHGHHLTSTSHYPKGPIDEADMSNNDRNRDGSTSSGSILLWPPRYIFFFLLFFTRHYLRTVCGNSGGGISSSRASRVETHHVRFHANEGSR